MGKPTSSTLASLAGLLSSGDIKTEAKSETSFSAKLEKEEVLQRVRVSIFKIVHAFALFYCIKID